MTTHYPICAVLGAALVAGSLFVGVPVAATEPPTEPPETLAEVAESCDMIGSDGDLYDDGHAFLVAPLDLDGRRCLSEFLEIPYWALVTWFPGWVRFGDYWVTVIDRPPNGQNPTITLTLIVDEQASPDEIA